MNTRFHIPSFGDEVFDLSDIGTEGTTPVSENLSIGSNSNYTYQQSNVQQEGKKHLDINGTISNNFYNVNDESRNSNTPLNNNNNSAGIRENSITNNTTRMLPVSNAAVTDSPTSLQSGTEAMASGDSSGVCSTNSLVGGVAIISEPAKPLSAYALFFRDTVSAIKQENPNCSFQELSRIVSSMWDVLDPAHKNVYNKRNEMARSDYIAQMKIYRQQQLEQQQQQQLQLQLQLQQQQEQQQQQQQQQEQHQETDEIVCQQKNALLVNDLTNVTQYTDHNNIYDHTSSNNNSILLQQQQQQQQQQHFTQNYNQQQQRSIQELQRHQNVINGESTTTTQVQYQQHHQQLHQQQSQEHQQQQQQQQQQLLTNFNVCNNNNNNNNNNNKNTNQSNSTIPVVSSTPQGPADKEQFINDSRDSYQKCTRENCNKRAIVNPDWEDEYCSNECVIIHCRSVFSAWVESNLQAKKLQQ